MRLVTILSIGLIVIACKSRARVPVTEAGVVGQYRANFSDRTDVIDLLPGGKYRQTSDYGSVHEERTGDWFIGQFQSQTEITLRGFKFNWPSGIRSLPPGGIGGLKHFPEVSDWTAPVSIEEGVPMLSIAGDDRYYYRKQ